MKVFNYYPVLFLIRTERPTVWNEGIRPSKRNSPSQLRHGKPTYDIHCKTYKEWSCGISSKSNLPQTEISIRVRYTEFITMLWKSDSRYFGVSARRSGRRNWGIMTPFPQLYWSILTTGKVWKMSMIKNVHILY